MSINYNDIISTDRQNEAVVALEGIARNLERIADALDSIVEHVEDSGGKPNGQPLG